MCCYCQSIDLNAPNLGFGVGVGLHGHIYMEETRVCIALAYGPALASLLPVRRPFTQRDCQTVAAYSWRSLISPADKSRCSSRVSS
jgi:hypothetical protein